jgi:hypothetical protein
MFSNGTEPVLVFTRQPHVLGIKRKIRVHRRVVPNPEKRLHPRIAGSPSRPLQMWRRRKKLALRTIHPCEHGEEDQPSPQLCFEDLLGKQPFPFDLKIAFETLLPGIFDSTVWIPLDEIIRQPHRPKKTDDRIRVLSGPLPVHGKHM